MNQIRTVFLSIVIGLLASGCSLMAPQYAASLDNVQALKNNGGVAAKVGTFTASADKANANPISLRGSSLSSPYQNSYANYVAEAIRQELSLAKRFAPDAKVEISGMLLKNDLDASGFSTGDGQIEARFIVKRSEKIRYDQIKAARHEWPSSFAGAIAIPRATQEYSNLVQKLLAALYADQAFVEALK